MRPSKLQLTWAFPILLVALQGARPGPRTLAEFPDNCEEGEQASGALSLICMPVEREWNGDLVIYAHGYVAFNEPIEIPDLELPDGTFIPDLVNGLGYAFATTSYSINGLAVLEGIEDARDLIHVFGEAHGEPNRVYLSGASEGGLVAALAVEQSPDEFDGGLVSCGPIGDFRQQINYWGDFRVLFDYFFPGLIPGSPFDIPKEVIEDWDELYAPAISEAVNSAPDATDQLLTVAQAPIDEEDPATKEETVLGLLWYNIFATNDGTAKLGGQPFGNLLRIYRGSESDLRLNRKVERVGADQAALDEIEAHYQTSGDLTSPVVSLHTIKDPIVPYWHVLGYGLKVHGSDSGDLYRHIPIPRYGHCEFKTAEVLVAFALLVFQVTGEELTGVEQVLSDPEAWAEYQRLAREHGVMQ